MVETKQLIPIISEGVKWVKEKMSPSKKDLKLRIIDLEAEVRMLSYGNQTFIQNFGQIMAAILAQLKNEGSYSITADTIIQIGENNGCLLIEQSVKKDNVYVQNAPINKNVSIFEGIDEEIALNRLKRPSEVDE